MCQRAAGQVAAQVLPCGKLWGPQGDGAGRGRLERELRELAAPQAS